MFIFQLNFVFVEISGELEVKVLSEMLYFYSSVIR